MADEDKIIAIPVEQVEQQQEGVQNVQGRVVKVLAVDMNFIMFPCIKLYFDSVNPDEHSTITWQNLYERKDIDQFLNIDTKAFLNITKIIKKFISNARKIKLVEYQKDIIDDLTLDNDGIMYDIVNLDFYHDLFIDPKRDKQKLKHFNKYNEMNWVGYIDAKEKLFGYHWTSTPNSPVLDPSIKFNSERVNHRSYYNIDEILEDQYGFEEIYISYSPNLVPHKFKYLADFLYEVFKKED